MYQQVSGKTAAEHVEAIESVVYERIYGGYVPDAVCLQRTDNAISSHVAAKNISGSHGGARCFFCKGTGFDSIGFSCSHCHGTGHRQ